MSPLLALALIGSPSNDVDKPIPAGPVGPVPVFRAGLNGSLALRGEPFAPVFRPGTSTTLAQGYVGFTFDGRSGGIGLGDPKALRLTKSLSLACWVRLESYAPGALESQIVFRGDDRTGLDPYSLRVLADGHVAFTLENAEAKTDNITAPIRLHVWTHVVGSLDDRSGEMTLWIDGRRASSHRTKVRPFAALDPQLGAGVSIGNVQTRGNYSQPLNGTLVDVAIYDRVVTPNEIHWNAVSLSRSSQGLSAIEG